MRRLPLILLAAAPALWSAGGPSRPAGPVVSPTESVLFANPPVVETAALYAQTLQEAPASVTVITRDQIRRYGYRTLAEALADVRGFYISSDGVLYYAGVRGFNLPGDYNTRTLVLLNGHYLTDNVYGAMYMFGQDFGLDMDLVERIEIVRGPSSALYGSNGVLATINIFTRAPADSPRASLATELGSFGQKKALLASAFYLGHGANLLVAVSAFHARGRRIEGAELGGLATGSVGAEQGYHSFAQLTWRSWSVTANFHGRRGIAPAGWYGADFGDTGTSTRDSHNFVEAAWRRPVGSSGELEWRLYYDQYRYYGRYDYTSGEVVADERDYALGDWVGTRLAYRRRLGRLGEFTFGHQLDWDLRNLQVTETVWPRYDRYREIRRPRRSFGVFVQHVYKLGGGWKLYSGVRFDDSTERSRFLSPRVAAVWQASAATTYKISFGRAFRNPSTYEQYWEPNPLLAPETVNAFEIAREQRLWGRLDLVASAYHYRLGRARRRQHAPVPERARGEGDRDRAGDERPTGAVA